MEIDVVDITDSKLKPTVTELQNRGKSTVLPYAAMSNGLNKMVHDVMGAAAPGTVNVLRIWAHGTPSVVGISSGDDPRLIRVHLTGISPGAFESPHQELEKLKPYFATGGRLELRGCQTGAGADAEKLMRQLADLLGVEVHASPEDQPITGLIWFGRVFVAKPGATSVITTSGIPVQ